MNKNYHLGFTLVELIVVMGVMVAVGSVIISLFISSLRGTNKVNNIASIREQGNYVISQIAKQARYAKGVEIDNPNPAIGWTNNCNIPISNAPSIRITDFDNIVTTYTCAGTTIMSERSGATTPSPNSPILNTAEVTTQSCSFSCRQASSSSVQTIGINFLLRRNAFSSFSEEFVELPFVTSVTVRNVPN